MTFALSGSPGGGAQTGFTSPTYTVAVDTAPQYNGKQFAVTALGGTQVGVTASSVGNPFTVNMIRPVTLKSAAPLRTNSNSLLQNNRNVWVMIIRKGGFVNTAAGIRGIMVTRTSWDIPAGMETESPAEIRASVSFQVGVGNNQSAGIGDMLVTGTS